MKQQDNVKMLTIFLFSKFPYSEKKEPVYLILLRFKKTNR